MLLSIVSFSDPPVKLDLELGSDGSDSIPLLTEDELSVFEKLISVNVSQWLPETGDKPTILPYRITGRTLRGKASTNASSGSSATLGRLTSRYPQLKSVRPGPVPVDPRSAPIAGSRPRARYSHNRKLTEVERSSP